MNIGQIMSPKVEYVREEDTAVTASITMRNLDVGALPVIGKENQLSGIITDRDLVVRGVAAGRDPATTAVREIMSPGAFTCRADQPVELAAKLMESNQVRRLVVVDNTNNAVGMVSLADIATKTEGKELAGEVTEEVSKPTVVP